VVSHVLVKSRVKYALTTTAIPSPSSPHPRRLQTPKIDKTEKSKHKTGRSKKRMQFNKRFVNVVVGAGKKKGPNAQSS